MPELIEIEVCRVDELDPDGCREFAIGDGDWPFRGFVVRRDDDVFAYQNFCMHVGHPLNWSPNSFLTAENDAIVCASHGARYRIETGECIGGPCRGRGLRNVDVEIRDGVIFVRGPDSM